MLGQVSNRNHLKESNVVIEALIAELATRKNVHGWEIDQAQNEEYDSERLQVQQVQGWSQTNVPQNLRYVLQEAKIQESTGI